jgi:hypothetical protein
MLILPQGHAEAIRTPRTFRRREKWMIGGLLATVAAIAVAVVIAVGSAGHRSANGCVDVTIPYSIGGQEFYKCGAAARALCAEVGAPGGFTGSPGRAIAAECRKARVAVD